MKNRLIYDMPTRLFHWTFAGLFVIAFIIAKTVDDESILFSYHMLAGFLLSFAVLLRGLWGFMGTRYARFNSFALHPRDLISYLSSVLSTHRRKWTGHNPASSWAALVMFALAIGLGITGYLMTNGQKETFEDVHELLANGFLVVAIMHVLGVTLHVLRHRDRLGITMIDGKKTAIPHAEAISNSRPAVALLFVGLITVFAVYLVNNFDSQNRTLNFFGTNLQTGESEDNDQVGSGNERHDYGADDDDDSH